MIKKHKKSNGLVDLLKREPPKSKRSKAKKGVIVGAAVGTAMATFLRTKKGKP